jgi:DcuC family C4-dicarboxylate transporter
LLFPHLAVATGIFWALSARAEARSAGALQQLSAVPEEEKPFRINLVKAAVPLLPITLLFLVGPPLEWFTVPRDWLADPRDPADLALSASRLIGAAMLVGVLAAALTAGSAALGTARAFFEGAGYAYAQIISVIVAASCFGKGVEQIGLARALGDLIERWPGALVPAAGVLPWAFGWVSGSGMASTQSLYGFFVAPARGLGTDPVHVGAVVSIAAAAGRTMSPVAAVALMCAALTGTNPIDLMRRLAVPLLAGIALVIVLAALH